jgi:long-chain acyl-CoA synthetase
MSIVSTPLPLALRAATLCEAFVRTAAERPGDVALRTPRDTTAITWAEYAGRVERIAAGLLDLGVERGDTVALMLLNRPEFHLVDTAALHAGAIPFSLYNTSSLEQAGEIFANARPVVAVTERALLPLVAAAARAQPSVRHVVLVDGRDHNALSLDDLEERGGSGLDLRAAARATDPGDVATLVYTSGTSGTPKGVELTHGNLLAAARAAQERLEVPPAGRLVSYLPAAHIVDRWLSHYHGSLGLGCTVTCVADPRQVLAVLPDARPTLWGGVPRVLEKLRAALVRRGVDDPGALTIEERIGLREKLGLGALRWLAGGAAPVSAPVLEYFGLLGVPVAEMWGMSETAGPGLANPPRAIRDGTCGLPVDGLEMRLAPDSELLVRGPMIMRGYHRQPERSRRAFTTDGWLRTGDIASMDEDGYVAIVDRKKDIIISSAGKNMAPARIERTLAGGDPRIAAVLVIGDRRPYNVALVVLEPRTDADDPGVREAVSRAIAEGNRRLSRAEQVKRWTILADTWSLGGDEITATGKPRRAAITAKYAEEIDALYAGPGESRLAEL